VKGKKREKKGPRYAILLHQEKEKRKKSVVILHSTRASPEDLTGKRGKGKREEG